MANPKIVYIPAGGTEQTLEFTSPPRQQPGYLKTSIRHDNISTAGIRESVLERIDAFLEFTMDYIQAGTDLANWASFLDYALTGGPFAFYPDASEPGYINCLIENTTAQVAYKAPGLYSLTLKFRQQVT